jgi:hypothetical protein
VIPNYRDWIASTSVHGISNLPRFYTLTGTPNGSSSNVTFASWFNSFITAADQSAALAAQTSVADSSCIPPSDLAIE